MANRSSRNELNDILPIAISSTIESVIKYRVDITYRYRLTQILSLGPASGATQLVALDAISTAQYYPTIFDFDPLFALLRTFSRGDDLHAWKQAHADTTGEFRVRPRPK
ncbi:hypothetical protein H4582DRAFT_2067983 [Lactarius indigo]|nr:hypothetical protein H4582DRAFT_2067983 [Lactarius indigo]